MDIRILYLSIVLIALAVFSCKEEVIEVDCGANSLCTTEEFVTITLEIATCEGEPVVLDDFYTFSDSKKRFEFQLTDAMKATGLYLVITDSELSELEREGTSLIFIGEKNGKNLVEHQMVIGHDCCHVQLIEGEKKIIVEE